MFNRIDAKMWARASMRTASPSPVLVTLVYMLLTTLLLRILNFVLFDPWAVVWADIQDGYTLEESLYYLIQENGVGLATFPVVQWVIGIYQTVMGFGYCSYALRLARNEGPGYANLFDGFAKFFRVLWMNILTGIFAGLWSLLAALPACVLIFAIAGYAQTNAYLVYLISILYLLAILIAIAVAVIVSLRYLLAPYFLLDDPTCTVREAIHRSKHAMKGWKMEAFTLRLSFFGWGLLSLMTFSILDVWVIPYQNVTFANFYDCVIGGTRHVGTPAGPDYGASGNTPVPF